MSDYHYADLSGNPDQLTTVRRQRDRYKAEVERLLRDREHMYQRALDAEAHAAFGPMDVDERVRALRALVDAVEDERDVARAAVARLRAALEAILNEFDAGENDPVARLAREALEAGER